MHIYLKGYYGYQNFGDELLLLGVINWLHKEYPFDMLFIEANDPIWLEAWLKKSKKSVKTDIDKCRGVNKHTAHRYPQTLKVFGGGEVITDARPFPWNGRNYLFGYIGTIWKKNYIVLGGIGSLKKRCTPFLYKVFLGRAEKIVTREETSYALASTYTDKVVAYHDFAYDVLAQIKIPSSPSSPYIIINVNTYLRNETVVDTIRQTVKSYSHHTIYFFPAAWGSDDLLYEEICSHVPEIQMYDWRIYTVEEVVHFIAHAQHVLAARLHVLLVAKYYDVSFEAIVYQEKIHKIILADGEKKESGAKN